MDGSFLVRLVYDDDITYNIVEAAERVLSKFFSLPYWLTGQFALRNLAEKHHHFVNLL